MRFPSWNQDATKIGMCSTPSPGEKMSVLCIQNSTAFGAVLARERDRFNLLFRRRAMTHHYTEFVEIDEIKAAEVAVSSIVDEYQALERGQTPQAAMNSTTCGKLADIQLLPCF